MTNLEKLFNIKLTENGDISFKSTGNDMIDLFFQSEYYTKHTNEVSKKVGPTFMEDEDVWKIFAMFMRDPRNGMGRRDLGRALLKAVAVEPEMIAAIGRYDDCLYTSNKEEAYKFLWQQVTKGDALAKKWMPRFNGKDDIIAKEICKVLGITQKEYRKAIKVETTESMLTEHRAAEINFEHVPSLAMLKYYQRFLKEASFNKYLEDVRNGKKKINTSVTNVYDLYKHLDELGPDADIIFNQIPKISLNCIPIVDTSGSMQADDCMGRAFAIGHYLAKCSTYCPDQVISFSSRPQLMRLWNKADCNDYNPVKGTSVIAGEMRSMYTGDCTNTDFGAVMRLLAGLKEFPEYLVVLSDMEFDIGSNSSKKDTMNIFKQYGAKTKIVWWNLNTRNTTSPEVDEDGNIFISGYNPQMLKFLDSSFDCYKFLSTLLVEYIKTLQI